MNLDAQLSRNGQKRWFLKKIFGVINSFFVLFNRDFINWFFFIWQNCCDLEHFSRPFAIWSRDNRSVDVQKPSALEKQMGSQSQIVSDSGNSPNQIGSRSQMSNVSQGFWFHMLACQGIVFIITISMDFDVMIFRTDVHLNHLVLAWTFDQFAFNFEGGTHPTFQNIFEIAQFFFNNDLFLNFFKGILQQNIKFIKKKNQF